jgi:hypothetical protein
MITDPVKLEELTEFNHRLRVTALRNGLRRLVRPDIYTKKEGSRAPVPHV